MDWQHAVGEEVDQRRGGLNGVLVDSGRPQLDQIVEWQPDETAAACPLCRAVFSLLRNVRKHHCRNCGCVACDACSQSRIPATAIPPLPKEREKDKERERDREREKPGAQLRLCDACFVPCAFYYLVPGESQNRMFAVARPSFALETPPTADDNNFWHHSADGYVSSTLRNAAKMEFEVAEGKSLEMTGNYLDCRIKGAFNPPLPDKEQQAAMRYHGRSLIAAHGSPSFTNCFISSSIAFTAEGSSEIVFRNCMLSGECALDVRGAAVVRMEWCVLLGGGNVSHAGTASAPSTYSPSLAHAVHVAGTARVTLSQCVIVGLQALTVTDAAQVEVEGGSVIGGRWAVQAMGNHAQVRLFNGVGVLGPVKGKGISQV